MSSTFIGKVKSQVGKTYEVKWDERNKDVYVTYAGLSKVGQASTAAEAMRIAEAWLYNK